MKHIKYFNDYNINEQENKKNDIASSLKDFVKQADEVFKSTGFGDLLKNSTENSNGWGDRISRGGSSKVPSQADVQNNIKKINDAMDRHGLTDKNIRAAIQGVIGKECGWVPEEEESYSNTSNDRIRSIFGKRVQDLSDNDLTALKSNNTKFWDRVYGVDDPTGAGKSNGNTEPGDGEKYRGRGFHGLTFKNEYKQMQDIYGKMGKLNKTVDLINHPESLNDPDIAAEIAVLYFLEGLQDPKVKDLYGTNDPNGFKDQDTAVKAIFNINAGLGNDMSKPFFQETLSKSESLANDVVSKNLI